MDPALPQLSSNRAVEDAAIAWVMELERSAGREPQDVRFTRSPVDIESPPRSIEVKACGKTARGSDIPIEIPQMTAARERPESFYLYVVDNVRQGDPALFQLRVLHGERLERLLLRVKEQRSWAMPWGCAEYDNCPMGLVD